MRKIYLASSWRNTVYNDILYLLRQVGHEVYDFRNPGAEKKGFQWDMIDPNWKIWSPVAYKFLLENHTAAAKGFKNDFDAMQWADTLVLVMPSGRSAHLEAGWAAGAGKEVFVLLNEDGFEPDLMYLMCTGIYTNLTNLLERLEIK